MNTQSHLFQSQLDMNHYLYKSANETLLAIMNRRGWTVRVFTKHTMLPPNYYHRLKKGALFRLRTYTTIGVALGLTSDHLRNILHVSGKSYNLHSREEAAFIFILDRFPHSLPEANAFLESEGLPPLTT